MPRHRHIDLNPRLSPMDPGSQRVPGTFAIPASGRPFRHRNKSGNAAGNEGSKRCLRKPDLTAVRQVAFSEGAVASKLPNPHCRAMREKIDSDKGRAIYAQRMGLIEPVFGHIQQRGLRRFTLRGQTKVDTQWKLFCIVHNVAKLQVYGKMAA